MQCEPIVIGGTTITGFNEHDPHVYVEELKKLPDDKLYDVSKDMIWFSAYARNRGGSDFHWMCDACYDECKRRGKDELFQKAHKTISESI
jgi:hypothetical protein